MAALTAGALAGIALGGQALGGAMNYGGQLLGYYMSRKSSSKARRFAREVMQNRYQWMRGDLEKAGFNPLLAVGASPGTVSAPIAGAPGGGGSSDGLSGVSSAKELALYPEVQKQMKALSKLRAQEATNAVEQGRLIREQANRQGVENVLRVMDFPGAQRRAAMYAGRDGQQYMTLKELGLSNAAMGTLWGSLDSAARKNVNSAREIGNSVRKFIKQAPKEATGTARGLMHLWAGEDY